MEIVLFMKQFLLIFFITYIITRVAFFTFDFSISKSSSLVDYFIDISAFILVYFVVSKIVCFVLKRDKRSESRDSNFK